MNVQDIEHAIQKLDAGELKELMQWMTEHHNQVWDEQIEKDLESGRLDDFVKEAELEYQSGQAKPL